MNDSITLLYTKQDDNTYLCRLDSTIPLADVKKRRSYYGRDMKVFVRAGNAQRFTLLVDETAHIDVYDGGGEARDGQIDFQAGQDGITVSYNDTSEIIVSTKQEEPA